MQRPDYYSILQIEKNASLEEIKASFRKLAMQHHPDKNPDDPEADEKFRELMEAYDVLSDPAKRKKYDSGRNYYSEYFKNQPKQKTSKQGGRKEYGFTEEELKRRQEFKERYDKYRKAREAEYKPENLPAYSDFKYIMLAIPLAIGLLFFIINQVKPDENEKHFRAANDRSDIVLAEKTKKDALVADKKNTVAGIKDVNDKEEMQEGYIIYPWNKIFGKPVFDSLSGRVYRIENCSGADAVLCICDEAKKKVIRNYYIPDNNYIHTGYIPQGNYYLNTVFGKNWLANVFTTQFNYEGMFDSVFVYARQRDEKHRIKIQKKDLGQKDTLVIKLDSYKKVPAAARSNNFDFFYKH